MITKTGYCKICDGQVKVEKPSPSHVFHLIMTIITGGLWIVIWVLCLCDRSWRCCECGSDKIKKVK